MAASRPSDLRPLCLRLGETAYPLEAEKVVIGRSRSCDIRLREDTVSRLHAALVWKDGELVIEDLGSSNGTYLNGVRVMDPQKVATGDVVRFGALRGTVERGEPTGRVRPLGANAFDDERTPGVPAGFGWRILALLVDLALFTVGSALPMAPLLVTLVVERYLLPAETLPTTLETKSMLAGACLVLWVLYALLYFVHGWARRGGSPGMKLCRLRLLDWRRRSPIGYSRAVLRLVAGLVTVLTLGLGFLLVPFRRDRKALHDLLAGTLVSRRPAPLGESQSSA